MVDVVASAPQLLERDVLLAQLLAFERRARRGDSRLVLVAGEAGAGKSALVDAFGSQIREKFGPGSVHSGASDAVPPSRAFAPLIDVAATVRGSLATALAASDRDATIEAFLDLVRRPAQTRVIVFEDLHWADAATLELLRVVGRRSRDLRVLVVGTYRDDEVDEEHPLRLALDDIPTKAIALLHVPPLTKKAVRILARDHPADAAAVYRATGGNAFFVTELLAGEAFQLPTTVREAVLVRASRLSGSAQGALRAASILGPRFEPELLQAVSQFDEHTTAECLSSGMLEVDPDTNLLGFRHELARDATGSMLSDEEQVTFHGRALSVLTFWSLTADVDPGRLVEHALGAGDAGAVVRFAPIAAERAAALGAHREAAMQYASALAADTAMDARTRAELQEAYARESRTADRVAEALPAQESAVEAWHALGDTRREGDALLALSDLVWFGGDTQGAIALATQAVALLEPVGPHGPELARAYATLAQRYATAGYPVEPIRGNANAALRLAEGLGEERVAVHALTTLGMIEAYTDVARGAPQLEAAAKRAEASGMGDEAARAWINLLEAGRVMRRFDIAAGARSPAARTVELYHLEILRRRLVSIDAELLLEMGRWTEAEELAGSLVAERSSAPIIRAKALTVLGHLHVRRGDEDPWPLLDEALALIEGRGEGQDLSPVRIARAEAAWLDGDASRAADEAARSLAAVDSYDFAWELGEAAWWVHETDPNYAPPETLPEPFALLFAGRHREAAASWEAIGAPYHRARALAAADNVADVREALEILHGLGARRYAAVVRRRLRALGAASVPRGPHRSTDLNPGRLTNRQLEVLGLLSEGLTNAQIAARLALSAKTVDHHVSAILGKLGVSRRAEAAERAANFAAEK
jgi:DNA-binding CsgD family transcriptional regulator